MMLALDSLLIVIAQGWISILGLARTILRRLGLFEIPHFASKVVHFEQVLYGVNETVLSRQPS